jgi:peptidoglycan/LPS O-acetylase OafA/YrhL
MTDDRIKDRHNSGIDVLRGIAILSVILLHVNIRVPFSGTYLGSIMPKMLYSILFWSGYYGVCIFFVISGFLITTSALHKWDSLPKLSLRGFYSMRFARIMPLLISLILILSVLHLIGVEGFVINPKQTSLGRTIFAALTFHINWLEIKTGYLPASWDVLWSLSIEEVFYFFFPIVCIVCRKEWQFATLIPIFLIISPFARTVWFPGNELADHNHMAYLDAISLGCIAAVVAKRIEINKSFLTAIALFGWFLFLLLMIFKKWIYKIGLMDIGLDVTLLSIGTAMVLIWMQKRFISGQQTPSRYTKMLRFLGRNSYEGYLTHVFVVLLFVRGYNALNLFGDWAWVLYISIVIISGILGMLVARYFSNPLNIILRERFKRSMIKSNKNHKLIKILNENK